MDMFATALPALGEAFALLLQPQQLFYLFVGVILGLFVGILPGLGGIAGLSLLLPFIYGMDPVSGLALMVGLLASNPTSDSYSSILLGIPGGSSSQATVLDGFPLARQGQAARALSAALFCAIYGGLISAIALTFFIFIARPLILAFGLPELMMLAVLGLSMVAILAGRVPIKGIVAAGLGLLAGTIGAAGAGGSLRMSSYDFPYLVDGLQLEIVALGMYAIPEIVSLLREDQTISKVSTLGSGWLAGIRDWWNNVWLSTRCALIGVFVGIIPGLGGSVVDWLAYGHAVQTTKDKSKFGKGEIRGVIGPESSANANYGGALIPTLIFGIPGSGSMAVFLGGLALLQLSPGPQMIRQDLAITYTIVWSLALATLLGAALCILFSSQIAKITRIPFTLMAPFLLMMIAFAAFQSRQSIWDLAALLVIGFIGIMLRRFDYSRPAFLIGFVLSAQVEGFTNMANQIAGARFARSFADGMAYLATPLSITILLLTIASIFIGVRSARHITENDAVANGGKQGPVIMHLCITAYVAISLYNATTITRFGDKIFPTAVGIVTLLACTWLLIRMVRTPASHPIFIDLETGGQDAESPHGLWPTLAWFALLLGLSSLLGFILALALFLLAFYRVRARQTWARTLLYAVAGLALMLFFAGLLGRDFPPGLLQQHTDLPWPFT